MRPGGGGGRRLDVTIPCVGCIQRSPSPSNPYRADRTDATVNDLTCTIVHGPITVEPRAAFGSYTYVWTPSPRWGRALTRGQLVSGDWNGTDHDFVTAIHRHVHRMNRHDRVTVESSGAFEAANTANDGSIASTVTVARLRTNGGHTRFGIEGGHR